jgi:glutaminyl-peptide cyclotransferase
MKKLNLLAIILLSAAVISCGGDTQDKNNLFSIDTSALKQQYTTKESLTLSVINGEQKQIDSVVYYIDDARAAKANGNSKVNVALTGKKFGYHNIKALVFYEGENAETTSRVELISDVVPVELKYEIVNTYPHDINAYTQGLEFYRDTLIEGTGQYRESTLRKVNYKTGEIYKKVDLEARLFGEGITVLNGKIYQLTWKENTGFIYDANTLKKEKEFQYFKNIEGWGLTNDGKYLYQSDGTEKIWILDPATLKEVDYINVYSLSGKIKAINELEWVDGKIYGNVYQTDAMAIIDPKSGAIENVINLSELKSKVTQHPELDVLNGIAYNPKTKTFFVTGKNWDKMFEIRIKK